MDAGARWSSEEIINNINSLGFDCNNLARLLLTHCHIDHIGGAPEIRKRFSLNIYIHKLDAPPLENGDPVLTAANWQETAFPPTSVDVKLNQPEEILNIGQHKIVCLHTPGHTPGSACAYLDKKGKRILFGQDIHGPLLSEFGSDIGAYGRSTKKLLDLDADILCEGHYGMYKTKKDVRNYIRSCRRQYGFGWVDEGSTALHAKFLDNWNKIR